MSVEVLILQTSMTRAVLKSIQ
jgi:hypothetical protein